MKKLASILMVCIMLFTAVFAMTAFADEDTGYEMSNEEIGDLLSSLFGDSSGEMTEDGEDYDYSEDGEDDLFGESDGDSAALLQMMGLGAFAEFDWETYNAEVEAKIEEKGTITLEDAYPDEYWDMYESMMDVDYDWEYDEEEDDEDEIDTAFNIHCEENTMFMQYIFNEVVDDETFAEIFEEESDSFLTDEGKVGLRDSIEGFVADYPINIDEIVVTIQFINGDETVMYEISYTYPELAEIEYVADDDFDWDDEDFDWDYDGEEIDWGDEDLEVDFDWDDLFGEEFDELGEAG